MRRHTLLCVRAEGPVPQYILLAALQPNIAKLLELLHMDDVALWELHAGKRRTRTEFVGGPAIMVGATTAHFNCTSCNALYHLIKAEAGPENVDSEIACRVCGAPLPGREGSFVLKYFLLRKALRPDPRARRGSQRAKLSSAVDTPDLAD
jgi:hypothetical protein